MKRRDDIRADLEDIRKRYEKLKEFL